MIDPKEFVFVVDENNRPLEPQLRSVAHKQGLFHRTSGIWVINKHKQVLTQKRSLRKDVHPGMWEAFFGGHVAPGEEYLDNAWHELQEELGVTIQKSDLLPYKVFKSDKPTHKEFPSVFGLLLDATHTDFPFEKEEIDHLEWKTIPALRKILVEEKRDDWVKKPWDDEVLTWLATL